MFNPYKSSKNITNELIDYISTIFPFSNNKLKSIFIDKLENIISKGPYLDIKPIFETKNTINELIDNGYMSKLFRDLEKNKKQDEFHKIQLPLDRPLYTHQVESILKSKTKNLVVTTGTGSGKTECFMLPIINDLLEEKEKLGFISNQVKVILIYPMNALANDQLKRLRNILMNYPDITFGSYTGETPKEKIAGEKKYADLHSDEDIEELKANELHCGLINEIKSREEMWEKPPHILLTNYAMLERMLLIPNNNSMFNNSDIHYIVLDEAHVYQGARGMETSLLIRRILARINSQNTKFILTSATLGEKGKSEKDICEFAQNLTSKKFDFDSIIYGSRKIELELGKNKHIDELFFKKATNYINDEYMFKGLCNNYDIFYNDKLSLRENIYDICFNSSYFYNLNKYYQQNNRIMMSVKELPIVLQTESIDGAISFIFVSSFGEKNNVSLLDSKYHFFLRALEGCYISFSKPNNLFLERKNFDNEGYKVFELAICRKCGDLALYGSINDGVLTQKSGFFDNDKCLYLHFDEELSIKEIEDEDESEINPEDEKLDDNFTGKKGKHKITKYYLCPKCGRITQIVDGKPNCDCGVKPMIVYTAGSDYDGCLLCNGGKYNKFYIGNDSATGVIATSLFEELPEKSVKSYEGGMEIYHDAGKQFLVFSDSRSEAAYFSTYLDKTYEIFLRRRAIYNIMNKNEEDIIEEPMIVDDFVDKVARLFKNKKTFKKNIFEEGTCLKNDSDKNSWYGILTEMVSQKKRNSLSSLGIIIFEYRGLNDLVNYCLKNPQINKMIDKTNIYQLLNEIVMSVVYWGAVDPIDSYDMQDEDRLFVFYSRKKKYVTLKKEYLEGEEAKKTKNIMSWLPRIRKNGKSFVKNIRYNIAKKLLKTDNDLVIGKFLIDIFNYLTKYINMDYRLKVENGNCYYFNTSSFIVKSPHDESINWYKCSKCSRISHYCLDNDKCSNLNCSGNVEKIDIDTYFKNNHYRNMYSQKEFKKLFIKEHTAQIASDDSATYQNEFEKNKINALSCSTTFEMGVDLGTLETVFLRDVPPNPSNYAQRSGRAGRSKESSAFTLTYAKLSSHDFNYFDNPKTMINGLITPPKFKINNEKVVLRHIFAVTLSFLLSNKIISLSSDSVLSYKGLEIIRNYLNKKEENKELSNILKSSFNDINCKGFCPWEYDWLDKFVGPNGALTLLVNEYNETLENFDKLIKEDEIKAIKEKNVEEKERLINILRRHNIQKMGYANQKLIDALSRGNVLPKYGFPVDNVQLDIGNPKIELSRDLSLAISEYAPGETVVANGKKYVSRYINKKIVGKDKKKIFTECYIAKCPNCQTINYSNVEIIKEETKKCSGCGCDIESDIWKKSIIPENGFYHDYKMTGEVSIVNKPEKIYSSEAFYVGDNKSILETTYLFNKNKVRLKHTENDEIMIVSKSKFYVCPSCGYTYGILDIIKDETGKKDNKVLAQIANGNKIINVKCDHYNKYGKNCLNHSFERYYLTHVYKTDVVQIEFESILNNSLEQMYSVMTALLDGISIYLDIERNDISGCLKMVNGNYNIIFYDAVPGGAGHVKRILDGTGKNLYNIFNIAINKMKKCNCGSSCYNCLRTYYNQKYHDQLNRFLVIDYLNNYLGKYSCESKGKKNPIIDLSIDKYADRNKSELLDILNEYKSYCGNEEKNNIDELISLIVKYPVEIPSYSEINCKINDMNYEILAKWDKQKIILVTSDIAYKVFEEDSIYTVFNLNDKTSFITFVSKIRS